MYLTSYYAPFYYIELQSGILDDYIYNTASPYANQANPTAVSKDTILLQEGYKSWVMVPQWSARAGAFRYRCFGITAAFL